MPNGEKKVLKFVLLRNPHGRDITKYDTSGLKLFDEITIPEDKQEVKESKSASYGAKRMREKDDKTGGIMLLELNDYMKYISEAVKTNFR